MYIYIYNYTHTILEMGLETCSSGSVSVCVLLGSDRAGRVLEWEVGRHSLDGWFSTLAALTPEKRCLKKKQFKTHPWNDEKCKHLPKERLRNRENCRMYRNV